MSAEIDIVFERSLGLTCVTVLKIVLNLVTWDTRHPECTRYVDKLYFDLLISDKYSYYTCSVARLWPGSGCVSGGKFHLWIVYL